MVVIGYWLLVVSGLVVIICFWFSCGLDRPLAEGARLLQATGDTQLNQ